jgi:hypothetical protein
MKENRIDSKNSKEVKEKHIVISSQDGFEARAMSSKVFIETLSGNYGCIDFLLSKNPNNVTLEIKKDVKAVKDEEITRIKRLVEDLVEASPEINFII